jgi:hypothetical protein
MFYPDINFGKDAKKINKIDILMKTFTKNISLTQFLLQNQTQFYLLKSTGKS